jgi:hypothetical protein
VSQWAAWWPRALENFGFDSVLEQALRKMTAVRAQADHPLACASPLSPSTALCFVGSGWPSFGLILVWGPYCPLLQLSSLLVTLWLLLFMQCRFTNCFRISKPVQLVVTVM